MVPMMNIIAWGKLAPWAEQRQVEQDLIISRAIVEIFNDSFLRKELRFRGGTALNKLHFPEPVRYSEDIDLVRTKHGPIKPVLRGIREVLEPWLGSAKFDRSQTSPKLKFRFEAEDLAPLNLKIEINTRETGAYDKPLGLSYGVENDWFRGEATVPTFSREEMLATKLRALLERDKGRDLFDLWHALIVFEGLDMERSVEIFRRYMERDGKSVSRAEAEERMFAKLGNPNFLTDIRPLLSIGEAELLTDDKAKSAFTEVFTRFIMQLPGEPWKKTEERAEYFGVEVK